MSKIKACDLQIHIDVKLSLWNAIKMRIAGKGYKELVEKMMDYYILENDRIRIEREE
jgi:hypothetical protein